VQNGSIINMEDTLLQVLAAGDIDSSKEFAFLNGYDHNELVGAIKSLEMDEYLLPTPFELKQLVLTDEGRDYAANGSPEARVYYYVKNSGSTTQDEITAQLGDVAKIGFGHSMKLKWIVLDKATKTVKPLAETIEDKTQSLLQQIVNQEEVKGVEELKKRKLIVEEKRTYFKISKGPKFQTTRQKLASDLTYEMLIKKSWKAAPFKPFNFNAKGKDPQGGHIHPLLKVRSFFRTVLLEMGFEEMSTNNFVETSFWNFDSLFQPQQHPARDAHDTFFLKEPASAANFEADYMEKVKTMHEQGGNESIGWRYNWSVDEAKKNILRTHTTAVSSKMLYQLAKDGFRPKKYFSIDRVFRNETSDATHLPEFHQIEGLIADRNLGLADLIGTISQFFHKIGITQLRFKPAYNPYTEPSMEIFGYHPTLKRWTEIGNSGVFRPEMLKPMGLPDDVSVIAWGLSVERPTMIQYNIDNIRDLFGHKVQLESIEKNPICRFEKAGA
jgi:phenylalanyl-tRNA synthetase alpha chain